MSTMKLIFLDVDGVLNTISERRMWGLDYVSPFRIELVNTICKVTDAKIVLSSAWRKSEKDKDILKQNGLDWIAQTPITFGWTRAEEIASVIKEKHPAKFVIIDDLDEAFLKFPPEVCFQTSDNDGFLPAMAESIIAYLGKKD